jgi:hypothetical protein
MSETILTKEIPAPRLGDVIFTRWPGWASRLTEWVTHGRAAHEEMICSDAPNAETLTASKAMNRIVKWTWESRKAYFASTKTEWCRFTPVNPLTFEQRRALHNFFQEAENTFSYSKGELLLQGLDSFHNWLWNIPYDSDKAVRFRKLGNIRASSVICSKVTNIGLMRIGCLPAWAQYWSPSDTLNKLRSSTSWVLAESTDGFFGKAAK